jgi:ribonuclease Z
MSVGMKVTLLGTGSPIPSPDRAGPSTLVQTGPHHLLFDCGRGVLMRLAAAGVMPPMLTALFITHMHSDHITDLNDVITTRWVASMVENPLTIVGPHGVAGVVDRALGMLRDDIGYRISHHDELTYPPPVNVIEVEPGDVFERDGLRVLVGATDHRPVAPTIGFRIEADDAVVAIAGDTVPCDGLDRLCATADIYVQTVIRPDIIKTIPLQRLQDVIGYHSSVEQAAQTATRNGVRTLVLTHQVPTPAPGSDTEWIAIAAAHFTGRIVFGHDLTTIEP